MSLNISGAEILVDDLKKRVLEIVAKATVLKNKYVDDKDAPVNYACIFSQSKEEYDSLVLTTLKIGKIKKETPTGLLFQIEPLMTVSGALLLLKIRLPDETRCELGDADFTISNYSNFKKKYLAKGEFKLIKREEFEMIE